MSPKAKHRSCICGFIQYMVLIWSWYIETSTLLFWRGKDRKYSNAFRVDVTHWLLYQTGEINTIFQPCIGYEYGGTGEFYRCS